MIKRFIESILRPFAWLWRRHERDVFCNGIEGQDDLDVALLNRTAGLMRDRLGKESEKGYRDKISMIVVTRLAPPGSVLVCRYEGKRYALLSLDDWVKSKGSIVEQEPPYPMGFVPLAGIPAVEDEDLAARILMANLPAGQSKYLWN